MLPDILMKGLGFVVVVVVLDPELGMRVSTGGGADSCISTVPGSAVFVSMATRMDSNISASLRAMASGVSELRSALSAGTRNSYATLTFAALPWSRRPPTIAETSTLLTSLGPTPGNGAATPSFSARIIPGSFKNASTRPLSTRKSMLPAKTLRKWNVVVVVVAVLVVVVEVVDDEVADVVVVDVKVVDVSVLVVDVEVEVVEVVRVDVVVVVAVNVDVVQVKVVDVAVVDVAVVDVVVVNVDDVDDSVVDVEVEEVEVVVCVVDTVEDEDVVVDDVVSVVVAKHDSPKLSR